jgi:hypothetical protein
MNRSSAQRNVESLSLIAHRLGDLCDEVTFVGGCITGLLITDKAAPDVRFTVDVDCIVNVITRPMIRIQIVQLSSSDDAEV